MTDGPYAKLYRIVSASIRVSAADYHLSLAILLKGQANLGKATIVKWVAMSLGMHLLEVCPSFDCALPSQCCAQIDCYDLVGETDVKTEGTLRARFDRAAECSPCILFLRHMEALVRTTQPSDTAPGLCFVIISPGTASTSHSCRIFNC